MTNEDDQNRRKVEAKGNPVEAFEFALDTGDATSKGSSSSEEDEVYTPRSGDYFRYVGDYEIVEELARGAMGIVFRGVQRSLNREVAVKMIHLSLANNASLRQRFRIEAEAVAALDHPNIVPIFEVGEHRGYLYFSMRYLSGGNLATGLPSEPGESSRSKQQAIACAVETIAQAVHHAHQRGILHRDLKPSNVLLDEAGEPVITDFGLAKIADQDSGLTRSEATLGTPAYMAPEQAAGRTREISVASDVYSIGAILYELLTGRAPFSGGSNLEIMRRAAEDSPLSPRQIDPHLAADLEVICLKALNKAPRMRYASALELAEDLNRWLRGEPILARKVSKREKVWLWAQRHPALAAAWATAGVLLALVATGLPWGAVVINRARLAEMNQRHRAETILNRAHLVEADRLLEQRESGKALGYLAAIVRSEPDNRAVSEKLIYNLTYRNWVLPDAAISVSNGELAQAAFNKEGNQLLALSLNGTLVLRDLRLNSAAVVQHRLTSPRSFSWLPDGERFVVLGQNAFSVGSVSDFGRVAAPVALSGSLGGGFVTPDGEALILGLANTRELMVYDLQDLNRPPWIPEDVHRFFRLQFRPEKPEVAVIHARGLSVLDYRERQQVFGLVEGIVDCRYGHAGDSIFARTASPQPDPQSGSPPEVKGLVLSSDTGEVLRHWKRRELDDRGQGPETVEDDVPDFGRSATKASDPFQLFRDLRYDPILHSEMRSVEGGEVTASSWDDYGLERSRNEYRFMLTHPNGVRQQVWDAIFGQPLFEWEARGATITAISEDATRFVRSFEEETAILWRAVETAASPAIWPSPNPIEKAIFVDSGRLIAAIDSEADLRVYDAQSLAPISASQSPLTLKRFAGVGSIGWLQALDGLRVVAVGANEGSLQLWDTLSSQPLSDRLMHPSAVHQVYWIPDVDRLVTVFESPIPRFGEEMRESTTAWVWNLKTEEQILETIGWEVPPCLAVSHSGDLLMLRTGGHMLRLWNVLMDRWQGNELTLTKADVGAHAYPPVVVDFSPDGQFFFVQVSGGLDIYRTEDGSRVSSVDAGLSLSGGEKSIQFVEDGQGLLVATPLGFAVCDTLTGRPRFPPVRAPNLDQTRVAEGTVVMTATGLSGGTTQIDMWNAQNGVNIGAPFQLNGKLINWQESEIGDRFLLVSDREWLLWNNPQRVILFRHAFRIPPGSGNSVEGLASPSAQMSPDGQSVMEFHNSLDSPLVVWRFPRVQNGTKPVVADLAESVGGFHLASDGSLQMSSPLAFLEVRDRLQKESTESGIDPWARWFITSPDTRAVSPYSELMPSEYANRLLRYVTLSGALKVIRRHPEHPKAWAALMEMFRVEEEPSSESKEELLKQAGSLWAAIEIFLQGEGVSPEVRIQVAEQLIGAGPDVREVPSLGADSMLRWICGGRSDTMSLEGFTNAQLIRIAEVIENLGNLSSHYQEQLDLNVSVIKDEITRLEELLAETKERPEAPPTRGRRSGADGTD